MHGWIDVCVCVYVCMQVSIHICLYVCMYVHVSRVCVHNRV